MRTEFILKIVKNSLAVILVLASLACLARANAATALDQQLIEAAKRGDLAVVKSCLKKGADINAADSRVGQP